MDKDWNGKPGDLFKIMGASNHSQQERAKRDYYATDPRCIDDLFAVERFSENIWEPACGEGHLSKRMMFHGKEVRESDIVNRIDNEVQDFLMCEEHWDGDIITNPPYSRAKDFVEKALHVIGDGHKVAMFLKLTFCEGKARRRLFEMFPPERIWVYSERQKCAKNGDFATYGNGSCVCYAWFVWRKGYKGETVLKWI